MLINRTGGFLLVRTRVDRKLPVEAFLRHLGQRLRIDDARRGEEDIDLTLFAGDFAVQLVQIGEIGHVTVHCGDAADDRSDRLVQFVLAAGEDIDERAFFNEALGGGETLSAAAPERRGPRLHRTGCRHCS